MKDFKTYLLLLFLVCSGQYLKAQKSLELIKPLQVLWVSDIKTTHLIFEKPITYVDLGSPYFVADTVQTLIKVRHIGEDVEEPVLAEDAREDLQVVHALAQLPKRHQLAVGGVGLVDPFQLLLCLGQDALQDLLVAWAVLPDGPRVLCAVFDHLMIALQFVLQD